MSEYDNTRKCLNMIIWEMIDYVNKRGYVKAIRPELCYNCEGISVWGSNKLTKNNKDSFKIKKKRNFKK